ncbi:MAG: hypothetical protein ACPG4T_08760, partial [Nannocystaceae bacterium]
MVAQQPWESSAHFSIDFAALQANPSLNEDDAANAWHPHKRVRVPAILSNYRDQSFGTLLRWCLGIFLIISTIRLVLVLELPSLPGYLDMALQGSMTALVLTCMYLQRAGHTTRAKSLFLSAVL